MPSAAPGVTARGDFDLVRRMSGGDESAVGLLYDRYGPVLHAMAFRIVGQRADAEEVVAEAFAQAWREAARFESARGSVVAWLTMIARSRALDLVRARGRRDRMTETAAREARAKSSSGNSTAMMATVRVHSMFSRLARKSSSARVPHPTRIEAPASA